MTTPFATDVILVFIGFLLLIVGFIIRDRKSGPVVLLIGVVCMMWVVVQHVHDTFW